ncbi:MAG: hypothetical protein CMP23_02675 [Rickettsiales bacterium]|nr:hypothetical protein [Rickettsiales bacterium]
MMNSTVNQRPPPTARTSAYLLGFALLVGSALLSRASVAEENQVWQLLAVERSTANQERLRSLPVLIEGGDEQELHLQILRPHRSLLDQAAVPYRVLVSNLQDQRPVRLLQRDQDYHSMEEIEARLHELAQLHPQVARVVELGRSWQQRPLLGLLITDQVWRREDNEPALRVLGTHHGDEWASTEVSLDLIEALLASYAVGDQHAALVDSAEIWFVPVVNPDGFVAYSRRNSRGVDLNRNYSYLWQPSTYAGVQPFSEVETAAVRALSMTRSFAHGLSIHSGASNLGWVWNHTTDPSPDDALMEHLCEAYLEQNQQPGFWITNGAHWYITHGDTNDWSYGLRGGHDYTLEVSVERSPPSSELEDLLGYHRGPALNFLTAGIQQGLKGRISNVRGQGLEAEVVINDKGPSSLSDAETGAFFRPLLPGDYSVLIRAPGHLQQAVEVEVLAHTPTVLNLELPELMPAAVRSATNLQLNVELGGEPVICGEVVPSLLNSGGQILAHRTLESLSFALDFAPLDNADDDCLVIYVDPEDIGEAWQREGEWHLLLKSNEANATIHLGLLLAATEPDFTVTGLELQGPPEALEIRVTGQDLPTGAMIRMIGPQGQRVLPSQRLSGDQAQQLSARFDASHWEPGLWSLRVFGRGHWAALNQVLNVSEQGIEATEPASEPPGPFPYPPAPKGQQATNGTGLEPGAAAAESGCSCELSASNRWSIPSLALVLTVLMSYFRRRQSARRTHPL